MSRSCLFVEARKEIGRTDVARLANPDEDRTKTIDNRAADMA